MNIPIIKNSTFTKKEEQAVPASRTTCSSRQCPRRHNKYHMLILSNRNLPNIISSARIAGTVLLLFIEPLSPIFIVTYTLTGVTDVLDGYIARKFGTESEAGARLDSIADLMFFPLSLSRIMHVMWRTLPKTIWYAVGALLLVKGLAYVVSAIKNHRFSALHTYLNKVTGLLVFGVGYVISTQIAAPYCWVVCVVGILASLEELFIHITTKE